VAAVTALVQASLAACALDFDRFSSTDASGEIPTTPMSPAEAGPDASDPDATQMQPLPTGPDASDLDATQMQMLPPGPDASPDASGPDAMPMPQDANGGDAQGPIADAGATDAADGSTDVSVATMDVAIDSNDAGMPMVRDSACTPSAICLAQGQSCGKQCSNQRTQCENNCGGGGGGGACIRRCRMTEMTCITQCVVKCTSCAALSGCSAANECLVATDGG
jgi:hypothetical protein